MDHPQPLRDKGVHVLRSGPSLAVLFHLVQWHLEEPIVTIAHNIDLGRFAGSRLEALYNELVSRDGIDDGEALQYGAYALLTPDEAERYLLDFVDSYSLAERFSNALVVTSAYPLTWSRVIWSLDDFGSAEGTRRRAKAGERIGVLRHSFEGAATRAKLPPELHQHDLRHRRVTTWLAAGGDAVKVKEAMGHADLRTTMDYTHLVRDNLRSLVEEVRASPVGIERGA